MGFHSWDATFHTIHPCEKILNPTHKLIKMSIEIKLFYDGFSDLMFLPKVEYKS
jgi:hypothetical protein